MNKHKKHAAAACGVLGRNSCTVRHHLPPLLISEKSTLFRMFRFVPIAHHLDFFPYFTNVFFFVAKFFSVDQILNIPLFST